MLQVPAESVTTERVNPVGVCVAATVAPGRTAALSSVTRPLSSAVAWAQAAVLVRTRPSVETTTSRMVLIRDLHPGLTPGDRIICLRFPPLRRCRRTLGRILVPSAFVVSTRRNVGWSPATIAPAFGACPTGYCVRHGTRNGDAGTGKALEPARGADGRLCPLAASPLACVSRAPAAHSPGRSILAAQA